MKVTEMHPKIQEKALRWYDHLSRREEEYVTRREMALVMVGKRRVGRPRIEGGQIASEKTWQRKD